MPRTTQADVSELFTSRWSPRSFLTDAVPTGQLASVFEAARWAPSCFNEQPWLFVYGQKPNDRESILGLLVEGNKVWAQTAPVLGIVFARKHFERNQKPNRWGLYDSGAAAMSMALQAHQLGLAMHFMGGFDQVAAHEVLGVSADGYEAMAAFALGKRGPADALPEELCEREQLSDRKPLAEVAIEGRLG